MCDDDDEEYVYHIVEFISRGRKKKCKEVDIVPNSWVSWDNNKKKCICKFMSPPYSNDDIDCLQSMVETCAAAPEDWPVYTIIFQGSARTYSEALNKLEILKTENHAFSALESTESPAKKQIDIEKQIRRRKLKTDTATLKSKLDQVLKSEHKIKKRTKKSKGPGNSEKKDGKDSAVSTHKMMKIPTLDEPNENKLDKQLKNHVSDTNDNLHYQKKDAPATVTLKSKDDIVTNFNLGLLSDSTISDTNKWKNIPRNKSSESTINQPQQSDFKRTESNAKPYEPQLLKIQSLKDRCNEQTLNVGNTIDDITGQIQNNVSLIIDDPTLKILENLTVEVEKLKSEMAVSIKNQCRIINMLETLSNNGSKNVLDLVDFSSKYQLQLPFKTAHAFEEFDKALLDKDLISMRADFCNFLKMHVTVESGLSKTVTNLLKLVISRSVAILYTAVKSTGTKKVFKYTTFFICMRDVIFERKKMHGLPMTDQQYQEAVSTTLSNAIDWDGYRSKRKPKKSKDSTEKETSNHPEVNDNKNLSNDSSISFDASSEESSS